MSTQLIRLDDPPEGGGGPAAGEAGGREQFEHVLDMLYRRRRLMLVVFLACLVGAGAYAFLRPRPYTAASLVRIDLADAKDPAAAATLGDEPFSHNARPMSEELFLADNSLELAGAAVDILWREHPELPIVSGAASSPEAREEAAMQVLQRTRLSERRDIAGFVQVAAESAHPEEAMRLANAFALAYEAMTTEAGRTRAERARSRLQQTLQARQEALAAAEDRISEYQIREGGVQLSQASSQLIAQITGLESERESVSLDLQTQRRVLAGLEQRIASIDPAAATGISGTSANERLAKAQEQLAQVEEERAEAIRLNPQLAEPGANRSALRLIDQQIARLREEVATLTAQANAEIAAAGGALTALEARENLRRLNEEASGVRLDIERLEARLASIQRRAAGYRRDLQSVPEQESELARLERERAQAQAAYESALALADAAPTDDSSLATGYVDFVQGAVLPTVPAGSSPARDFILGLFFALAFALGVGVIRDRLDNRIYKIDQIERAGLSSLGLVPNLELLIDDEHAGSETVDIDGRTISTALVSLLNPTSTAAESYRHLRTSIQFGFPDSVIQTLLVSSAGPSEGKTTTAANLAISMAQAGRRVLLLDADLRKPSMHRLFGIDRTPGLQNVLSEGTAVQIRPSGVDNLFLLPAGWSGAGPGDPRPERSADGAAHPAEQLGSVRMRELLGELRQQFDLIVVDTPPILAATDAALLSTQCDATLLVVRGGQTLEGELEYARESIRNVGGRIVGAVLNGFDLSMAYGYRYRYQYYSRYGQYGRYGYGEDKQVAERGLVSRMLGR